MRIKSTGSECRAMYETGRVEDILKLFDIFSFFGSSVCHCIARVLVHIRQK